MNLIQKSQIKVLEQKIRDASQAYYSEGNSQYTDEEFDNMILQLQNLNPESELLHKVGHGYDIATSSTPGAKFKHKYQKASSLDKAYSYEELPIRFKDRDVQISLKLDGLSMLLYYIDGKLLNAVTRGDGITGIDVTDKISHIVPKQLADSRFTGAIRGELIMTDGSWKIYHEEYPDSKNSRNSVAGIISAKDNQKDLEYITFIPYNVVGCESASDMTVCTNINACCKFLKSQFHEVVPYVLVSVCPNTNFEDIRNKLNQYRTYPDDGIVIKDISSKYDNNNYAVICDSYAYKFAAETKDTTVVDVEWNLTRNRKLFPKVIIDTVQLSGTSVSAVTGNNAKYIELSNIGRGAKVTVTKSGQIIPKVVKVIEPGYVDIPTVCPCCGCELKWSGVDLICPNDNCQNASAQDILMWIKTIAPTDGLGDKILIKFLNQYLPSLSIDDIYNTDNFRRILDMPVGPYMGRMFWKFRDCVSALLKSIIPLSTAIQAANIPRFGAITSAKASEHPQVVKRAVLADNADDSYWEMIGIVGVADSECWRDNFNRVKHMRHIVGQIDWSEPEQAHETIQVAITGKLSMLRNQFEQLLSANNFKLSDVNKDTTVLITDNPDDLTSSKAKKANKLGIPAMTEAQFRNKYNI